MTFYSGFLDDFFGSILIYVFHHVLLLQINTSQMTNTCVYASAFVCEQERVSLMVCA